MVKEVLLSPEGVQESFHQGYRPESETEGVEESLQKEHRSEMFIQPKPLRCAPQLAALPVLEKRATGIDSAGTLFTEVVWGVLGFFSSEEDGRYVVTLASPMGRPHKTYVFGKVNAVMEPRKGDFVVIKIVIAIS